MESGWAESHIDNAFVGQPQVRFEHFSYVDIMRYINREQVINTQICLSGKAIQENFNYKRVIFGRISVIEVYKLMEEFGNINGYGQASEAIRNWSA